MRSAALKFAVLLCFLFSFKYSEGQQIFQKTYDNYEESFNDFLIKNDSVVYFFGSSRSCGTCKSKTIIVKANQSADFEWSYKYDFRLFNQQSIDVGSGIVLFGICDSLGYSWDYGLFKIDYDGNVLRQKRYGTLYSEYGKITKTVDNGFLISGYTRFPVTQNDTFLLNVIKVDSIGEYQWSKFYHVSAFTSVSNVTQLQDSSFIITGTLSDSAIAPNKGYISKFDFNGQIQWIKVYSDSLSDIQFDHSVFINSNELICSGYIYGVNPTHIFLISLDTAGNCNWAKKYDNSQNTPFSYSVLKRTNGNFIVNFGNVLLTTDSLGNYIKNHSYFPTMPSYPDFFKSAETADNGLLMAGTNYADLYITKLDSLLDGGCYSYTGVFFTTVPLNLNMQFYSWFFYQPFTLDTGILNARDTISFIKTSWCETATGTHQTSNNFDIVLFPNPVNNQFSLSFNKLIGFNEKVKIRIYNGLGHEIFNSTYQINNEIKLNSDFLKEGIYLLSVERLGDSIVQYLKFIKIGQP